MTHSLHQIDDSRVTQELDPGERLLWSQRPRPSPFIRDRMPQVLVGIPFTLFACVWTGFTLIMGSGAGFIGWLFPLWGLMFCAIGMMQLASPLFAVREARQTLYALTDQRLILWTRVGFSRMGVQSYRPGNLPPLTRIDRADGSGDLLIESPQMPRFRGSMMMTRKHGLRGIDNVRDVESLIRARLHPAPVSRTAPLAAV